MIWRAYIDLDSVSLSEESAFDDLVEFLKNDPVGSQLLPLTRGPKCGAEVSSLKILKSNFIKTKTIQGHIPFILLNNWLPQRTRQHQGFHHCLVLNLKNMIYIKTLDDRPRSRLVSRGFYVSPVEKDHLDAVNTYLGMAFVVISLGGHKQAHYILYSSFMVEPR